jgi:serine/threonine-protein kinase
VIVFAPDVVGAIYKVSDAGGTPVAVTHPPKATSDRNPVFLSDGKTFLYTSRNLTEAAGSLYAGSIDGKLQKRVAESASNPAVAGGHVFFVRDANLVSVQFDESRLELRGAPVALASNVEYYVPRDAANFSVGSNTLAYVPNELVPEQVGIFDRAGRFAPAGAPGIYRVLDVSPDGKRIAVNTSAPKGDVWIIQSDSGLISRVTFSEGEAPTAVFSPDGTRLATLDVQRGLPVGKLSVVPVAGGPGETLLNTDTISSVNGWSADGRYILLALQDPGTGIDVGYFDLQQKKIGYVVRGEANEFRPSLSPDGKWLAYTSTESGSPQIYVTEFPTGHGRWQVTTAGGIAARWSHDGKQLFFSNSDKLFVADFTEAAGPQFSAPRQLQGVSYRNGGLVPGYAPLADGRIASEVAVGDTTRPSVHLIVNWAKLMPN